MRTEQAILASLDRSAQNAALSTRARSALGEVHGLGERLADLEAELTLVTQSAETRLRDAARHLLVAGGKRVRPTLVLLSCGACGGRLEDAVTFACAAELTHSATLLHDDVIDEGSVRRGQPASRVLWGNAVSVLSGDWLLTRALELVADSPARAQALPGLLATMRAMVEGEVLQLARKGSADITEAEYQEIVRGKTASLFAWAASAGAWAAHADPAFARALGRFGEELGVAFQLVDDCLDFDADPALLGKKIGADLAEGKMTLPLIRACEAVPGLREKIALDPVAAAVEVHHAVRRTGAAERVRAEALERTEKALEALATLPESPHRRALEEAAVGLVGRAF